MAITCVLFDLDGTLLPMDQEVFTRAYMGGLAKKFAPLGFDPQELVAGVWEGTAAMVANDGSRTNEAAFWDSFTRRFGDRTQVALPVFEAFYANEFQGLQAACGHNPAAAALVRELKEDGLRLALATNPIFPALATESRMKWAGIDPADMEFFTSYENTCFCKPNPAYYRFLLEKLELDPQECLMVGNDAEEDLVAEQVGMQVFLLTDCLINKTGRDTGAYPQGGFEELRTWIAKNR